MSVIFLKSLLSIATIIMSVFAMFTMFEILGRNEKRYDVAKIKRLHKANGIIYFIIFIFVSYFCLEFIIASKTELTPRGTFHAIFALTIIVLFGIKISFIRVYRQFYNQVKTIGLLIALITFGMVGTSGGYYLLVTKFGTDRTFDKIMEYKMKGPARITDSDEVKIAVKTDPESIGKGRNLFDSKCYFCHDAFSAAWGVGPGLKGILKNPTLPVSKKPATPENVANQIRNPYKDMPSFSYLPEEDILNLIAYLNTL